MDNGGALIAGAGGQVAQGADQVGQAAGGGTLGDHLAHQIAVLLGDLVLDSFLQCIAGQMGKIWELADPSVSVAHTPGLEGTPNELKLKYLADNDFAGLSGKALQDAIKAKISQKDGSSLVGQMAAQGTTPRRLTDLIGSLCDLTSGSGDKGTPIVYIQGYFDNYTAE